MKLKPIYEAEKKEFDKRVEKINHIWDGKRPPRVSEFSKPENYASKEAFEKAQGDVSEEAISELFNSMYKEGVKR